MTTFNTITLVFFATCTSINGNHQFCHNTACFDTGRTQLVATFDGDELLYVDFDNKTVVWESKVPSVFHLKYSYLEATYFKGMCEFNLKKAEKDTSITKTTAAPEVLIYPGDDVIDQIDNTLICLVQHFSPPTIKIQWTKNREVVATDDPFKKSIPGSDGTFQVFSRLDFVPKDGDIYSCIVEHEALEKPVVKFFKFHSSGTDIGPTAYCAFCLILGLTGFTAGMFFFVKGYIS